MRKSKFTIQSRNYLHLYLLTPWCRVLLEKLTGLQLVKKLPAFHGTQRFIAALTSFRHPSLSWASPIQSIYPHPTSWRSVLILTTHLCLGLPSGLFPSGFPTKTLYTPLTYTYINKIFWMKWGIFLITVKCLDMISFIANRLIYVSFHKPKTQMGLFHVMGYTSICKANTSPTQYV